MSLSSKAAARRLLDGGQGQCQPATYELSKDVTAGYVMLSFREKGRVYSRLL